MKQLVILSGKGGTGKTSVTAAFAHLAHDSSSPVRAVLADADVDAANLELVLNTQIEERHIFIGGSIAVIDPDLCTRCGNCVEVCRFDALSEDAQGAIQVDPISCEGCAACMYACPVGAIHMEEQEAGEWFRSETRYGPLYHAALRPAQENSGKLVALVKKEAKERAEGEDFGAMIVDGPPGIGCPVIAAVSGADMALVVAEPTVSGIHDMERAIQVAAHFRVPAVACLNKADLYTEGTAQIEAYCHEHDVEIVGHIPFDATVTDAMVRGEPITAYRPDAPASRALVEVWGRTKERMGW